MILTTMFMLGFLFAKMVESLKRRIRSRKALKDCAKQFYEVMRNLKKNRSVFISRVNQTVMIDMKLKEHDTVNIIYLMDKKLVCIFKQEKCIYSSDTIGKEIGESIIAKIHEKYGREINDVVQVLGVTISREELASKMKDFEKTYPKIDLENIQKKEDSDIDKIIIENERRLDLDEILDKISIAGMDRLTTEELDFLKEQGKK